MRYHGLHKICVEYVWCLSSSVRWVVLSGDLGKTFSYRTVGRDNFSTWTSLYLFGWVFDSRNNKNHLKSNVDLNLYGRQESSFLSEKKILYEKKLFSLTFVLHCFILKYNNITKPRKIYILQCIILKMLIFTSHIRLISYF